MIVFTPSNDRTRWYVTCEDCERALAGPDKRRRALARARTHMGWHEKNDTPWPAEGETLIAVRDLFYLAAQEGVLPPPGADARRSREH